MTAEMRHFYQKNWSERLAIIRDLAHLDNQQVATIKANVNPQHDAIIENYLTDYQVPLGIAVNFVIDGQAKLIPMATEEPSVIAAASNAAKIVKRAGGFQTTIPNRQMVGQIVLSGVADPQKTTDQIMAKKAELLQVANAARPSIVKRGGGARELRVRDLTQGYLSVDLLVDVQEAMGANIVNTMAEAVAKTLGGVTRSAVLMSILSNYATDSLATAKCAIPVSLLAVGRYSGELVAEKIAAASEVAQLDPYRATTHNKGIMNGVDALVLASGNDWRAIESGSHAYAARNGQYRGLATWKLVGQELQGELTLPLPLGTVGGSISINPMAQLTQQLLKIDHASDLARCVVALGLAQNLAAIRALVTSGIQKGHMRLQMKSLAIAAGATQEELPAVVQQLEQAPQPDLQITQAIIQKIRTKKG